MTKDEQTQLAPRDSSGRFVAGNPGGPGRPARLTEKAYLRAMSDAVPMSDWVQIVRRAVQDAINGDRWARQWLSTYLMGSTTLNMSLSPSEWSVYYSERAGSAACSVTEEGIEAEGLQPHMLSQEDRVIALALVRTMVKAAETGEQEGQEVHTAQQAGYGS